MGTELKVEVDRVGGVASALLFHKVTVTAEGPKGAAFLLSVADANSLSGDVGQRRMLDLHILE